jgi:hypothetical protein
MKELPYHVRIPRRLSQYQAQVAWCSENFGPEWLAISNKSGTWCCFWAGFTNGDSGYDYHFANEADATMFALRWG